MAFKKSGSRGASWDQRWDKWLRECVSKPDNPIHEQGPLNRQSLGALTGQDSRALHAIAACWELYAGGDAAAQRSVIFAVVALLPSLQTKCHRFARELIARSLDWDDRARLWALVQGTQMSVLGETITDIASPEPDERWFEF